MSAARGRAGLRIGGVAVAAALALTACATDRKVTRPAPVEVTAERVAEALVTEADLPEGYAAVDDDAAFGREVLPEHACDDALAELTPEVEVGQTFRRGEVTVTHVIGWFPGQGPQAEAVLADVGGACAGVVATDTGVAIRAGRLDFGVLSDDVLPIAVEVEAPGAAIEERDLVVVRRGDLVSVLRVSGPRPSDKVLIDGAVRAGLGRLGLLHEDTAAG